MSRALTIGQQSETCHQRTPAGWSVVAARHLGVQPATAESWLHGRQPIYLQLAAVIRALVTHEEVELLAKVDTHLDAARSTLPIPVLDDELIQKAVEADEMEAIARERYLLHRSHATLKGWRLALESQRGMGFLLLLAVQNEERLSA